MMRARKYKNLVFLAAIIVGVLAISACKDSIQLPDNQNIREASFYALYPTISMNDGVKLKITDILSEPLYSIAVSFVILNQSDKAIVFPGNFGTHIYGWNETESDWYEIKNKTTYFPGEEIVCYPITKDSGLLNVKGTSVSPDVSRDELPLEIRVVVIGQELKFGQPTGIEIGAFVDVTLSDVED